MNEAEKVPVQAVAQKLGLTPGKSGSFGPCPCCGSVVRGSTDKRGPIGIRRDQKGWKCHKCGMVGSGIDLVAARLCGLKFKDADSQTKDKVNAWFQGSDVRKDVLSNPMPKPTVKLDGDFPPREEVMGLWKSSHTLNRLEENHEVFEFLKLRKVHLASLSQAGVVRVTPDRNQYRWPKWWPGGRSMKWRLIVPAFDSKGQFRSIHARAIGETNNAPKTLWPSGFQASGLFMPNRFAVKMMRKEDQDIDGVIFVEGITDFIKVSTEAHREGLKLAVLGGTSGSFSSVSKLSIPSGVKVYIGTDPDAKGDSYATTIQTQLGSRVAYRLPLRSLEGATGGRP